VVRAKVYVTLKPGVLDPAGKAIERALHALGFEEAHDVRLGKFIELRVDGDATQAAGRLDDMCRKLLANGVIEDYRFEVGE
jgi:phosphoribosylformylglycinamidine synthase